MKANAKKTPSLTPVNVAAPADNDALFAKYPNCPTSLDKAFDAVGITSEKGENAYLNLMRVIAIVKPDEITKADLRRMRTVSEASENVVRSQLLVASKTALIIGSEAACDLIDSVANDSACVGAKYHAAVALLRTVNQKAKESAIKHATPEQAMALSITATEAYTADQAGKVASMAAARKRKAEAAKKSRNGADAQAPDESAAKPVEQEYKELLAAFHVCRVKLESIQVPDTRKGAKSKALKALGDCVEQVNILAK